MKIDIKKMCSEFGFTYKIIEGDEYGFFGGAGIIEADEMKVYYYSNAKITRDSGEKLVVFYEMCSNDNEEYNYIMIKKMLSKVIVKYKKLQIKLKKDKLKEDFV